MTRLRRMSAAAAGRADVATVRRLRRDAHRHRLVAEALAGYGRSEEERARGPVLADVYRRAAVQDEDAADRLARRVTKRVWDRDLVAAQDLARSSPLTPDEASTLVAMFGPGLTRAEALDLVAELRPCRTKRPVHSIGDPL